MDNYDIAGANRARGSGTSLMHKQLEISGKHEHFRRNVIHRDSGEKIQRFQKGCVYLYDISASFSERSLFVVLTVCLVLGHAGAARKGGPFMFLGPKISGK